VSDPFLATVQMNVFKLDSMDQNGLILLVVVAVKG